MTIINPDSKTFAKDAFIALIEGSLEEAVEGRNGSSTRYEEITSIGDYAFIGCPSLTSVNLPNATSIGSGAFEDCPSLTSVNLPSATGINSRAFSAFNPTNYCTVTLGLASTDSAALYVPWGCRSDNVTFVFTDGKRYVSYWGTGWIE